MINNWNFLLEEDKKLLKNIYYLRLIINFIGIKEDIFGVSQVIFIDT